MHNTIRMVLAHVHNHIPDIILSMGYNPMNEPISIDKLLHEKTIKNRVLMDCNLVGGKRKDILLTEDMVEKVTNTRQESMLYMGNYSIYRIPEEFRDYRPITAVVSLGYPNTVATAMYDNLRRSYGANAHKAARAALNSQTLSEAMVAPTVELISGDMIKIYPAQFSNFSWVLTCNIAYDENFSSLNPDAVQSLQALVLCAVKSYLYKELVITIDMGKIMYGGDVGAIKDMIYKWEGEEEKYSELLGEFSGAATMDIRRQRNIIYNML